MATRLFPITTAASIASPIPQMTALQLSLSQGGSNTSRTAITEASGAETFLRTGASSILPMQVWMTDYFAFPIQIAGTVSVDLCFSESAGTVNVLGKLHLYRWSYKSGLITQLITLQTAAEVATSETHYPLSGTPTTLLFERNDRLLAMVSFINTGTMGAGTASFGVNGSGPIGSGSGVSNIDLTENVTFTTTLVDIPMLQSRRVRQRREF